ncbi:MAG: hypothetical protein ACI4AM_01130 [Muribaculaceae bacterium]
MKKVITDPESISQAIERINNAIDRVLRDEEICARYEAREVSLDSEGSNSSVVLPTTLRRVSSYKCDIDIIRDMFEPKHYTATGEITHTLVMQRLSLIDLFYSTSLNRYGQFGIYELAYQICELSKNNNGQPLDHVLAAKAQAFVSKPSTTHELYEKLFNKSYAIPDKKAVSIISKYLFFLLEVHKFPDGFPIYDSIVMNLLPKIGSKIGIPIVRKNIKDITQYIEAIKKVAQRLGIRPRNGRSVFGVLDFFLWRIGKVGELSFSLLLTYHELKNCLWVIEKIKDEGPTPGLIMALPSRFSRWLRIYNYIIQ